MGPKGPRWAPCWPCEPCYLCMGLQLTLKKITHFGLVLPHAIIDMGPNYFWQWSVAWCKSMPGLMLTSWQLAPENKPQYKLNQKSFLLKNYLKTSFAHCWYFYSGLNVLTILVTIGYQCNVNLAECQNWCWHNVVLKQYATNGRICWQYLWKQY